MSTTGVHGTDDHGVSGLHSRRPGRRAIAAGVIAVVVVIAAWFSIPQASNLLRAGVFPAGSREIGGTQLNESDQRVSDILMADHRIEGLLAQGAVIDKILPIEVASESIDPQTGESRIVKETWAQAWLVLDSRDWGVQVDPIRGQIVSMTDSQSGQTIE